MFLLVTSKDNIFHVSTLARLASHFCSEIRESLCLKSTPSKNSITKSARKTCTSEDDIENIKLNVVHVRRLLIQFQSPFCSAYFSYTTFLFRRILNSTLRHKNWPLKGNKMPIQMPHYWAKIRRNPFNLKGSIFYGLSLEPKNIILTQPSPFPFVHIISTFLRWIRSWGFIYIVTHHKFLQISKMENNNV